MINAIVFEWIEKFLSDCGARNLREVDANCIYDEIHEAEANLENCLIFEDELGEICSRRYISILKEALEYGFEF